MNKALQRELKLFFLIPKNIYLPISVFGIIFVIFLVLNLDNSLNYASSFIASFITIFIISENSFKDDHMNGYLEQKLCEGGISDLISYLMAKWITNLFFVFAPISVISLIFQDNEISIKLFGIYIIMLSTLYFFFNLGSAISLKRNNSLNALLIIPLLIPFIILVEEMFVAGKLVPNFNFLMAYFIFSASFINYAIIQILKIQSK